MIFVSVSQAERFISHFVDRSVYVGFSGSPAGGRTAGSHAVGGVGGLSILRSGVVLFGSFFGFCSAFARPLVYGLRVVLKKMPVTMTDEEMTEGRGGRHGDVTGQEGRNRNVGRSTSC